MRDILKLFQQRNGGGEKMLELDVKKFNELQGNITDIEMARKLKVSRTQLWRIKNKKSSVGEKFIAAFMETYPSLKIEDYFFTNSVAFQEHYNKS